MEIIFICEIKISAVVKSSTWLSKYKLSSHLETTKNWRDFRSFLDPIFGSDPIIISA